jgi:toxin ParE1/3/4
MFRLVVKPEAEADIIQIVDWYNGAQEELGDEFFKILDRKMNLIAHNPFLFPKKHKNIRRALIDKFPFGVFFIVENDTVFLLAVIHSSRNPQIWKRRK